MRNREQIYRVMSSCTDSFGNITKSQQDMADLLEMSYQQLSKVYTEFMEMGMLKKDKHRFTVLYDPEQIPWDSDYKVLRDQYIQNTGAINATKSDKSI